VGFTASARRRFLLWGCAGILTCLALCVLARRSPETLNRWDQVLQIGPDWWRGAASWLEGPLVWLSYAFGTVVSVVGTAVVAGLLLAKRRNRAAVYVVLVILGTILVTSLLKLIVDLPRPVVEDPILQYASSGMPSGHASNIAAATTAACVLSAIHVRKRARRRLVLVVGVLMALIVGLNRLMLGVHTLTEVAAGYALGVGVGLLTAYLFDPSLRRNAVLVKESS
jgi:undecaprenyl-diphosphatase